MFIRDGRFDFLTMLDRDSCISYDTKTKLESLHVREKLMDMMKERRKDIEMFGRQKNVNLRQIETKAGNAKQGNDSFTFLPDKINFLKLNTVFVLGLRRSTIYIF